MEKETWIDDCRGDAIAESLDRLVETSGDGLVRWGGRGLILAVVEIAHQLSRIGDALDNRTRTE